jgi:FdhD protein
MCGRRNPVSLPKKFLSANGKKSLKIAFSRLMAVSREMQARQAVFKHTGGTHAAAIFKKDGSILSFAEDFGRHNALDKAIGKCMLHGISTKGKGVMLSGRVSYEMAAKIARAQLELAAAVSAPSSLAVEIARRHGITLCGFVREDRATIYTHPGRVTYQPTQIAETCGKNRHMKQRGVPPCIGSFHTA